MYTSVINFIYFIFDSATIVFSVLGGAPPPHPQATGGCTPCTPAFFSFFFTLFASCYILFNISIACSSFLFCNFKQSEVDLVFFFKYQYFYTNYDQYGCFLELIFNFNEFHCIKLVYY
jgi:hypothetical protein